MFGDQSGGAGGALWAARKRTSRSVMHPISGSATLLDSRRLAIRARIGLTGAPVVLSEELPARDTVNDAQPLRNPAHRCRRARPGDRGARQELRLPHVAIALGGEVAAGSGYRTRAVDERVPLVFTGGTIDYRLVDGEQGSRFLADVGALLTEPRLALTW
jgi:hypothetical protein